MFETLEKNAPAAHTPTSSLLNGVWDHTAQTWSDAMHGRATVGQYLEFGAEAIGVTALVAFGGYKGVSKVMSLTERNSASLGKVALSMESGAGIGGQAAARTGLATGLAETALSCAKIEQATAQLGAAGSLAERATICAGLGKQAAVHINAGSSLAEKMVLSAPGLQASGVEASTLARAATGLDTLPLRAQSLMTHGAEFTVVNPKTGSALETTVSIIKNEVGQPEAHLFTQTGERVALVRSMAVEPPPGAISPSSLYGHPRTQQSFLWLDFMRVDPKFQGQGVKEALVEGLRQHSLELGLGGRIKLQAVTDFQTVSAIPWYKAGFRPQVGAAFHGETFEKAASSLEEAVKSGTRLTLEEGQKFNNLLMYLPGT